jgi:hypothetical protein
MGQSNTYTWQDNPGTNLAYVYRVVITSASFSIRVNKSRILPRLRKATIVEKDITLLELCESKRRNTD